MKPGSIHIDTSGWMYKDWGKEFYPPRMKKGFLQFLAAEFPTVEVNSSFYHLPLPTTFAKWKQETPEGFVFAVKLSRFITHQKRLEAAEEPLTEFLARAKGLGAKLGPVLIQLPPSLRYDCWKDFLRPFATRRRTRTFGRGSPWSRGTAAGWKNRLRLACGSC